MLAQPSVPGLKTDFTLPQRINDAGIALIKNYEGLHSTPFLNTYKLWCIGYGHTRTVHAGMQVTAEQAHELLMDDLRIIERMVLRLVKVPLNENQFSALVSFVFDTGITMFERSVLLSLLNRGWYQQVPAQLVRFNKPTSQISMHATQRRRAEGVLWSREC